MQRQVAAIAGLCAALAGQGAEGASLRAQPAVLVPAAPAAVADVPASWQCAGLQHALAQAEAAERLAKSPGAANATSATKLVSFLRVADKAFGTTGVNVSAAANVTRMAAEVRAVASKLLDESSQMLNNFLQAAADKVEDQATEAFLRTLKLCASCDNFERVGESHDGGYIICADGLANSGLVGAYSYGINGFDGWGMDLASRYNIPLYEYDCFDTRRPEPCSGCQVHFFPECLRGPYGSKSSEYKTFLENVAFTDNANAPPSSLMLKIDVEGAEWDILSQEDPEHFRQVRQLNLELHHVCNERMMDRYLKAMQTVLAAGFSVSHLHGNNHGGMCNFGQFSVPDFIEVTLIRRTSPGCDSGIPYRIPEDRVCAHWAGELPDAVLPSAL